MARREGSAAENKLRALIPEGEVDFVKRRHKYYSIATRCFVMTKKNSPDSNLFIARLITEGIIFKGRKRKKSYL